jgi:RNA polymerase sigma-70 factor (ECF subfamily)
VEDFEAHRAYLHAVAYRMLGSANEADDAVQEAWLRLARADRDDIDNARAWLTTVVARVCLDMLRTRTARREVVLDEPPPAAEPGPEEEAVLADTVGVALLVVLDTLSPAERLAFVLHDTFSVPFDRIAAILGRSVPATKMLASRARRRVRASRSPDGDPSGRWRIVEAFLAASRRGDFAALLELLDPDATARADAFAAAGSPVEVTGADIVARQALAFSERAARGQVGFVDGGPAILVTFRGRLVTVLTFAFAGDRIAAVDVVADPARLERISSGQG